MKMCVKTVGLMCVALLVWANAASAVVLWSEDFQGFTAAENTGTDIVGQDGTWSVSGLNTSDHHANVADQTYDNGLGWAVPGWSLFGDLPVGEKVLAVQGRMTDPQTGDGIVTATKTLPALGATQTTLTASMTMATIWNGNRWFTNEILIRNSNGDNIVNLFMNMLSQPSASVWLNGVRIDDAPYNYAHSGNPGDFDFVMDFTADTVDMYVNDVLIAGGIAMDADYSNTDVQDFTSRVTPYTQNNYQGIIYLDNLEISEIPEPMTLSLLALGGLTLIRRRR